MRAFIAYFIPDELKKKIVEIQNEIKSLNAINAKFVEEENLHLSFTFLGEISDVERIIKELESFRNRGKIEAKLKNLLLIPNENYFRVIAIGVESEEAENLRKEIYKKIGGDSKPLHLTLCRVKSVSKKEKIIEYAKNFDFEESFVIDKICLVKSTLTSEGPIYEVVYEVTL